MCYLYFFIFDNYYFNFIIYENQFYTKYIIYRYIICSIDYIFVYKTYEPAKLIFIYIEYY